MQFYTFSIGEKRASGRKIKVYGNGGGGEGEGGVVMIESVIDVCKREKKRRKNLFVCTPPSRIEIEAKDRFFFLPFFLSFSEKRKSIVPIHPFSPATVVPFYI